MTVQDQEKIKLKKEYLKGYEKAVRQMERAELKVQEIRLSRVIPPVVNDGMPHTHNNNDLSAYAVLVDKAEKEYMKRRYQRIKKCKEITDKIERLEDEDEKDILMYRYIKLLRWIDIQEKMGITERQIYRIHSGALKNFKLS